jgi:hypothetical protein
MDHLWLERFLLFVSLLSSIAAGGGGYIETMRKVSAWLLCREAEKHSILQEKL